MLEYANVRGVGLAIVVEVTNIPSQRLLLLWYRLLDLVCNALALVTVVKV